MFNGPNNTFESVTMTHRHSFFLRSWHVLRELQIFNFAFAIVIVQWVGKFVVDIIFSKKSSGPFSQISPLAYWLIRLACLDFYEYHFNVIKTIKTHQWCTIRQLWMIRTAGCLTYLWDTFQQPISTCSKARNQNFYTFN